MRRYSSKPALFKVIIPLALAAIVFIIHSCKKEMKSSPAVSEAVAQAKAWYESAYPVSAGTDGKLVTQGVGQTRDLSKWIKPDWQHPAVYKRLGKNVFEMPIDPSAKFSSALKIGKNFYNKKYTRSYFLLLNDG